ncbi:MAG TPA: hypothetical protein VFF65_11135, partial [Phycisphaerales bacterium]|nr:hypothetical protein [Phycisphaerales bacterium]
MANLQRAWRVGLVAATMAGLAGGVASGEPQAAGGAAGSGGNAPVTMPRTEKRPVEETLYGRKLVDNYRWLEGDNSDKNAMGKRTAEVDAWTDAQNGYTRSILDNLPGRKALEEQLRPLMEIGTVSAPSMRGEYYFYTKREGKENQPKVLVRKGHNGTPRVLLDPAQIDATGLTALGGLVPSHDGKLVAVGLYRAG